VFGVLCFVPIAFAGPIVHLGNGRPIPAVISFFAWTSLAGTTFIVGGLSGVAAQQGGESNMAAAWIAGLAFGAAGAVGLTALDVWMARTVHDKMAPVTGLQLRPSIVPTHGGAMASLGGSF
jgi:hypothetical protein